MTHSQHFTKPAVTTVELNNTTNDTTVKQTPEMIHCGHAIWLRNCSVKAESMNFDSALSKLTVMISQTLEHHAALKLRTHPPSSSFIRTYIYQSLP